MTPDELAVYRELTMVASYGVGRSTCFLCGRMFMVGERLLMVPNDCGDTEKMHKEQPFNHRLAHRRCMEQLP